MLLHADVKKQPSPEALLSIFSMFS